MKKSLYISTIALMLSGAAFTSCSDFLEASDKTNGNQDAETYLNANPEQLLMTTYNSIYNFVTEVELTDDGTDLYMPTRGKTASAFDQYTFNASTSEVQNYYVKLYGTINYANGVIEKSTNAQNLSEAKFIRSWCYYLLTQQFGAVPYSTSYIQNSERSYPRQDLATTYAACIKDLQEAMGNFSTAYSVTKSKGYLSVPTREACYALIAKFYLAWGWDIDTEKGSPYTSAGQDSIKNGYYKVKSTEHFAKAGAYADSATVTFANGLTMPFGTKWAPDNENNAEVFWAIQYDRASYNGTESDGGHSLQSAYGNYYGECTATAMKQSGSLRGQNLKSAYLYEEGDDRYDGTYMTTMYNKTEATPTDAGFSTGGYYYYYKNPSSKAKICYRYFPYYVSTDSVENYLNANKERYAFDKSVNNASKAYIIGKTSYEYTFNTDGSYNKKSVSFSDLALEVAGGVTVKKYDDADTKVAASNDYRDVVVFHASDSYLDAAEAYFMAGSTTAAEDRLYVVRSRSISGSDARVSFGSYSPAYQSMVYSTFKIKPIDLILDERARELYAERTRWIDLRRTNQLIRYNLEFNSSFQESNARNSEGEWKIYRPIPEAELGNNIGMDATKDQNPGY